MMSDAQFVELMGQLFERDGVTRIAGRIFGRLLLSPDAMGLDELASALQVSKGSVSTNTRLLERMGLTERLTYPGDRKDYYQISQAGHESWLEMRMRRIQATRSLLSQGLATPAAEDTRIRERLQGFDSFFESLIEVMARARDGLRGQREGSS